jgi:16S rRNA processing protein RimM
VAEYFLIAKALSVQGKNGFLRIFSYSDFPERFFNLQKVYIDFFGVKKEFFVEDVQKKKDFFTLKLKNFDSEKDVELLVGKDIFVDESDAVKPPKGQFFIHDIIGSSVYKNNFFIGKIKEVYSYPGNDVYVIDVNGKEVFIPAVKDFIESFDTAEKKLFLKTDADIDYDED